MSDELDIKIKNLGDITDATIIVTRPIGMSAKDIDHMADILEERLGKDKWFIILDGITIYNLDSLTEHDREILTDIYHAIGEALKKEQR